MAARFFRSEAARPLKFGRRKPSHKEGRLLLCTRFSFERERLHAKRNSLVVRAVIDWGGCVRTRRRIFSRSAGAGADAVGRNYDIRADCREGRAERCNRIYYPDGFARADNVPIWR